MFTTIDPIFGVGADAGITVQPIAAASINWLVATAVAVPVNKGVE